MNAITRILMGDKSDKQVMSYLEAMFDSYVVEDSQVSARYLTYPIRPAR